MAQVTAKRAANIRGQKHMLAYITKGEARMLRKMGGSGKPGPNGIPAYYDEGDYSGPGGDSSTNDFGLSDDFGGGGDDRGEKDRVAKDKADRVKQAQQNLADSAKNEVDARPPPVKGLAAKTPVGAITNAIAKGVRGKIVKELDAGGTAIFNKSGEVMGVMHDGPFGLGKVYTGRTMAAGDYVGPEEFRNNVTMDGGRDDRDENIRGGAANKVTVPKDVVDGKSVKPPTKEQSESVDATKEYGAQDTIATTPQGLLNDARTRRRSLFSSGLIA